MTAHAPHAAEEKTTVRDAPDAYLTFGPLRIRREYFVVLVVLSVLTLAEIAVASLKIDRRIMGTLLVAMAVTKAAFVGLFYMHLKHEKSSLLWLAFLPLPLAGFYAVFLMLDAHNLLRPVTAPWLHH